MSINKAIETGFEITERAVQQEMEAENEAYELEIDALIEATLNRKNKETDTDLKCPKAFKEIKCFQDTLFDDEPMVEDTPLECSDLDYNPEMHNFDEDDTENADMGWC